MFVLSLAKTAATSASPGFFLFPSTRLRLLRRLLRLMCLFGSVRTVRRRLESGYSICVCAPARSCAITSLAAPGRLIRPPLPWRRPVWQEAKWCWRDHCHLGPNEIQLRPNVRQDDSKRWATWQPARQPARKTQRHICAKREKTKNKVWVRSCCMCTSHTCTSQKVYRGPSFFFGFIYLFFLFAAVFQSPLTLVVFYWLTAILRHKHRLIVSCLKSQSAPQICGCSRALDRMRWQRGLIFHRVKVLRNH